MSIPPSSDSQETSEITWALCDGKAFQNSTLPRLTWVGGTGEGWWEVDDFSKAFRRLSNLKMAI